MQAMPKKPAGPGTDATARSSSGTRARDQLHRDDEDPDAERSTSMTFTALGGVPTMTAPYGRTSGGGDQPDRDLG